MPSRGRRVRDRFPKRKRRVNLWVWEHYRLPTPTPPPPVYYTRPDGTTYEVLTPELVRYRLDIWAAKQMLDYRK